MRAPRGVAETVVCAIFAAALLGGLYVVFLGGRNIWRGMASKSWPQAEGVVVTSATDRAEILVKYSANGAERTTSTIHFGQTEGSTDDVSEVDLMQLRYPVGRRLPVHYHPSNPALAVVNPGFHSDSLLIPGIGVAISLIFVMAYASFIGGSGMSAAAASFATIFMLIGFTLLVPGLMNIYGGWASERWPSAKAKVATYGTSEPLPAEIEGSAPAPPITTPVFVYQVAGVTHYSNNWRYGSLPDGADPSTLYPSGAEIDIRYNPSDPNVAVAVPGFTTEAYWLPGAGVAFFLFALAVFLIIVPALRKDF